MSDAFDRLDLNLLRVLHVVLDEMSVTRAARRLHVTPSAVSNALNRLRSALDDPLLVRDGRGLTATPRARELGPILARTLGDLGAALDQPAAFDPATTTRALSLALGDSEQVARLGPILTLFTRRLPRATLRVVSVDTLVAAGGLAASNIDCAIGPSSPGPGTHEQRLYTEEGVVVVREGHPRIFDRVDVAALREERHVDVHLALGRPGRGNEVARRTSAEQGLERDVAVTVPTFVAALMVAQSTDLVAAVPRSVAGLAEHLSLRVLPYPFPMRMDLCLAWHDRTDCDPAGRALRECIVDSIGVG